MMKRFRKLFGVSQACCFAMLVLSAGVSRAGIIDVFVDTTPIQGTTGALAFDFLDGDGLENNEITISNFTTDAILANGVSSGDVTGDLSGPLVLGDAGFFNEWLQDLAYGAFFSFRLESTANGPFSPPDAFSLFLLDSSLLPYATDDPLGTDALLVLDISSAAPVAQAFASANATVTIREGGMPVPAPSTLLLLAAGGIGMLMSGAKKKEMKKEMKEEKKEVTAV